MENPNSREQEKLDKEIKVGRFTIGALWGILGGTIGMGIVQGSSEALRGYEALDYRIAGAAVIGIAISGGCQNIRNREKISPSEKS